MRKITSIILALMLVTALFPKPSFAVEDASFEEDLKVYLTNISKIRGFEVTRADLEDSLSYFEDGVDSFTSVDDLSAALGEVINNDKSNLTFILEKYDLSMEELEALLDNYGESIDDYIYLGDLIDTIEYDLYLEGEFAFIDEELINDLLITFQEEFGLTEEEVQTLTNHLASLEEKLSSYESIKKLEGLGEKLEAFGNIESLDDLSDDEIQKLLAIYNEFLDLMELKLEFSLIKNGAESELSLMNLVSMKELINANLKINIYDLSGNLLADLIVTGEMVDSGTASEIGKEIDKAAEKAGEEVAKAPQSTSASTSSVIKTEKGGKLPNTAGNYGTNVLLGFMISLLGAFVYRTNRKVS